MRYRLRTLLIVLTVGCAFLAWVAYLRQTAAYHRREAERLAFQIADYTLSNENLVHDAVELYAAEGRVSEEDLIWHPNYGRGLIIDDEARADWDSAVRHQRMAAVYDGAILKPWTLLATEPDR
jgi:hypothetical protein